MKESSSFVVGVDLGGTAMKLGRIDRQGRCLASLQVPTPQPSTPDAVLTAMVAAIRQLDPQGQAQAIGVGSPGPSDAASRVARIAINLKDWQDVPVADYLEAALGKPVLIENDANCAGVGEAWCGAGQDCRSMILLTLGTGVGGAIIWDGKLLTGRDGAAGELGLITLHPEGPDCRSGNSGSLEQFASLQGIRRRTGLEPKVLGERAAAGDEAAIAFWQDYGRGLGAGIASLIYVLTPEVVLIGGGISASFEWFAPTLRAEVARRVMPTSREGLQILRAALGNDAGMIGAAKLMWNRLV